MNWHFKYTGPRLPWLAQIRIWLYLKRCERLVKQQMKNDMTEGRIWNSDHVRPLVKDAEQALRRLGEEEE